MSDGNHPAILSEAREVIPGAHVKGPMKKIGSKLKLTKEPPEVLAEIAIHIKRGNAFSVNPEKQEAPWEQEAGVNLGTLFLNYRVSTRGKKVFAIGYKDRTKIDVFLEDQADELLEILKTMGIEDFEITLIDIQDGLQERVQKAMEEQKDLPPQKRMGKGL